MTLHILLDVKCRPLNVLPLRLPPTWEERVCHFSKVSKYLFLYFYKSKVRGFIQLMGLLVFVSLNDIWKKYSTSSFRRIVEIKVTGRTFTVY